MLAAQQLSASAKKFLTAKVFVHQVELSLRQEATYLQGYVIHAVGPIYDDGEQREAETLARCYKNSLRLAVERGIRSIAFPAISTGNFRYPIEPATRVALTAVKAFVEQAQQNHEMVPERIQFVLFDEEAYTCYVNAFSELGLGLFSLVG